MNECKIPAAGAERAWVDPGLGKLANARRYEPPCPGAGRSQLGYAGRLGAFRKPPGEGDNADLRPPAAHPLAPLRFSAPAIATISTSPPRCCAFDEELHLVDLDAHALAQGVARQGLAENEALHLYGNIDVTGQLAAMGTWASGAILDSDLEACIARPVEVISAIVPGRFDVVASCCLLSQLIGAVVDTAGEGHPRFRELVQAVRLGHLRLLMHLVAPGGRGVLITDLVSSTTAPPLAATAQDRLPHLLGGLIEAGNFFDGVNPAVIRTAFAQRSPQFAGSRYCLHGPVAMESGAARLCGIRCHDAQGGGDGTAGGREE